MINQQPYNTYQYFLLLSLKGLGGGARFLFGKEGAAPWPFLVASPLRHQAKSDRVKVVIRGDQEEMSEKALIPANLCIASVEVFGIAILARRCGQA